MDEEARDAQRWGAVEDATELMLDGQHEQALTLLKHAIEDDPQNGYAYHHLGTALYELRQFEPARDAFRAAVRVAPEYLAARVGLAQALVDTGEPREALKVAEETLRRFPNDGDAYFAAGRALAALGDKPRAIQCLEQFLTSKPEVEASLEARSMIALLQASDGPVTFD